MVKFGAVDGDQQPDQGDDFISDVDDDDFLDPQPGQGDDDFMSDDADYPSGQDDDDFMSESDEDEEDLDDEQPDEDEDLDDEQPEQGDLFTVHLTGAIRRDTRRHGSTQQSDGASSEHYDVVVILPGGESYTPDHADEDDDDEEEPVHAALEAAEAPGDDCCPVCLQQDGEAPPAAAEAARPWRRVAPCGHRFHAACVEKWLRVKLSCPVCRCPAAGAGCCPDAAPEPPRPIPDIVEEFLATGYDESLVFEKSPRWMEFTADTDGHVTSNSSRVSSLDVAA